MNEIEMLNRIYDKLFDNIGMSKYHVDIDIIDQYISNDIIDISIQDKFGNAQHFEITIKETTYQHE